MGPRRIILILILAVSFTWAAPVITSLRGEDLSRSSSGTSSALTFAQFQQLRDTAKSLVRNQIGATHLGFRHGISFAAHTIQNLVNETLNVFCLYFTFPSLITQFSSDKKTLEVRDTQNIVEDLSVPRNVAIKVVWPGKFIIATNKTLTINGSFASGPHQCIVLNGTGKLVFSAQASIVARAEWWGAKGDDATDNTAPLNAAAQSGAKVIKLGKGIYRKSGTWVGMSGLCIEGEGYNNTIVYTTTAAAMGINCYDSMTVRNIALRGTKTGTTLGGSAIYVPGDKSHGTNLLVEHCKIYDWDGNGLSGISHCIFKNNLVTGITAEGCIVIGDYNKILNNDISDTKSWGIDLNSSHTRVEGNRLYNCGQDPLAWSPGNPHDLGGIIVSTSGFAAALSDIKIINNTIDKTDLCGIILADAPVAGPGYGLSDVVIKGNIIRSVNSAAKQLWRGAIYLAGGTNYSIYNILLADNQIYNGGKAAGITLQGCKDVTLDRNIVDKVGYAGIYLLGNKDPLAQITITNNIVQNVSQKPLYIRGKYGANSHTMIISNNIFSGTISAQVENIIYIDYANDVIIKGNYLKGDASNYSSALKLDRYTYDIVFEGNTVVSVEKGVENTPASSGKLKILGNQFLDLTSDVTSLAVTTGVIIKDNVTHQYSQTP